MLPWEHFLVGYLLYSLYTNLVHREPPNAGETASVALGSQLPDLIDKPLSWTFGVFETGYALGHSIFVAPFVCAVACYISYRHGNRREATAFSIAYLSHLIGDVIYPIVLGRGIEPAVVLWPIRIGSTSQIDAGLIERSAFYIGRYIEQVTAGEWTTYMILQLLLGSIVVAMWIVDGFPVASDCYEKMRGGTIHLLEERK